MRFQAHEDRCCYHSCPANLHPRLDDIGKDRCRLHAFERPGTLARERNTLGLSWDNSKMLLAAQTFGDILTTHGHSEGAPMGLGDWLRKMFGGRRHSQDPSQEMVPFLDAETGRVVRIPASELHSGAIQIRLQGSDEVIWALAEQLHQGEIKHPEFDEGIREYVRRIQAAFAEHRSLSFEEWEEGFRRDANPEKEIALWTHAANVYTAFAGNEPAADRRKDIYRCIMTCLTTGPDAVWKVLRPELLSQVEAEQVVNRFFGKT